MRAFPMRVLIVAVVLAAILPAGARAKDDNPVKGPVEHLDEALQNVLDTLGLVLQAVPQYELPEVLPNGDIIIRRVHPGEPSQDPPEDKPKEKPKQIPDDAGGGIRT